MFTEKQLQDKQDYYKRLLNAIGSLSNLFSESPEPYLSSRATENLFCKAFDAVNLSRRDASVDASKDRVGLAIKTFLEKSGKSMQKVAEFNSDSILLSSLGTEEKIKKLAELRNERIEVTKRVYGLDDLIYHCITRKVGKILVYEMAVSLIDIPNIRDIKTTYKGGSIQFSDSLNEYSFNISKSTLFKRFISQTPILEVPVKILADPFTEIEKIIAEAGLAFSEIKTQPHVFLPLYSMRGGVKNVPPKSGLNQWNAKARFVRKTGNHVPRNPNEIYVPIPAWIHRKFPTFFPARDKVFELTLPDRKVLSASVCQDGSKALMTNPNADLGQWLLRDVLNLPENQLLTYDKLQEIGLDTVVIYKVDNERYDIDFTRIGSYEKFEIENRDGGETETEEPDDQEEE